MQISQERLDDNKVEVTVIVTAKEVDAAVKQAYKDFSHKYRIPGFRKGHAPRPVIDSMFTKEGVLAEATNQLVNDLEPKVLDEADITPLGNVEYGDASMIEEGKDFEYKFTSSVRPVIELNDYEPVKIYLPSEEVTEEEVDTQVEMFQRYYASIEDIKEERSVEAGDLVEIDMTDEESGKMNTEGALYELGTGEMPENFDENLIGMTIDEPKSFDIVFPIQTTETDETEDADDSEAADDEAASAFKDSEIKTPVTVTIKSIKKRVLPEVDDEFVKMSFGLDTVDAMRDAIKTDLETQKSSRIPQLKEQRAIAKLGSRYEGEIDKTYLNVVFNDLAGQFLQQLSQQGSSLDAYLAQNNISADQFMADLNSQASDVARESLALDAMAQKLGIEVTQEDIDAEFERSGAEDPKATQKEFLESGRMPSIREFIRRTKTIEWAVENAEVTVTADGVDPEETKRIEEANEKAAEKREEASKKSGKKAEEKKPAEKKATAKKKAAKKDESDSENKKSKKKEPSDKQAEEAAPENQAADSE